MRIDHNKDEQWASSHEADCGQNTDACENIIFPYGW